MFVLFHGRYNSTEKQLIGIYSSIEAAQMRANKVVAEDAMVGLGTYALGPGISYSSNSGILFRGQYENPYSLWVEEIEVDK
jgi:hypothetical protein